MGLLQVSINTPQGEYVDNTEQMKIALQGSDYSLDEQETKANGGIAMITTKSEAEDYRLIALGNIKLPSGFTMEIPS